MKVRRHETVYTVLLYDVYDSEQTDAALYALLDRWMDEGVIWNWYLSGNYRSTYKGYKLELFSRTAKLEWPEMLKELRTVAELDIRPEPEED